MKVLVTGFEPFDGAALNSSWELARRLGEDPGVTALQLPCRFASSLQVLDAALRRLRPRVVLALGQTPQPDALRFERVAVNWVDARIADNDGLQPIDEPVLPGAPAAHFSTLPLKRMLAATRAAGVPAEISFSAGSYVCNQVFFGLQHRLRRRSGVRSGFVHVPGANGALSLDDMLRGLRAALAVADAPELTQPRSEGQIA